MSAPPHFNPSESLIPDVRGVSIGGVQGGGGQQGGGSETFLGDLIKALKGKTIHYKDKDGNEKSHTVPDLSTVKGGGKKIKRSKQSKSSDL